MEDSPAISPDGKTVAFVAGAGGRRQIWLRLLAGGAPLQITHDEAEHEQPRWAPDSSSLIYYVPSDTAGEHGTIWEIAALGGPPRRIAAALGGGDISHDGRRIAMFRFEDKHIALVLVTRDGSGAEQLRPIPPDRIYGYPRWSPDDRWIACQQDNLGVGGTCASSSSARRPPETRERSFSADCSAGLRGQPDGSGVVYSSAVGSTLPYPPLFNLRPSSGTARATASSPLAICRMWSPTCTRPALWQRAGFACNQTSGNFRSMVAGGEHTPRASYHASDRPGPDAFGEPGRSRSRLPVREWRPRQLVDRAD